MNVVTWLGCITSVVVFASKKSPNYNIIKTGHKKFESFHKELDLLVAVSNTQRYVD